MTLLRCRRVAALCWPVCLGAGADVKHPLQHGLSRILVTERLALNATHRHSECLGCHEVLHKSHGDNITVVRTDVC